MQTCDWDAFLNHKSSVIENFWISLSNLCLSAPFLSTEQLLIYQCGLFCLETNWIIVLYLGRYEHLFWFWGISEAVLPAVTKEDLRAVFEQGRSLLKNIP